MQTRISILFFTNIPVRGGAEEHILTLLRGLDRRHFSLHLVCRPELVAALAGDVPSDVEVIPLCLSKVTHFRAAVRLLKVLRERRIGILHSHMFRSSLFASPLGCLVGVPVIVETPHIREHWRQRGWKSHFVVDQLAGRFVDYYIAVSEANARYLEGHKGLPARKIVVIQNGRSLGRFNPLRRAPAGLRQSLGFNDDDPVLVVAGRLEPQKGHRVLLEAMPRVLREWPRTRLVCAGAGSLRGQLEEQARVLGLDGSVRFVGYQSNIADWLALADISVLPSDFEGLPLVAIESLATGRPMVATAVDGTTEVVLDGKTGLTVPPGDPTRLAGAICRLLASPELRRTLGEAGRRWVLEHFSEERQVRRTQEFYWEAWERHALPKSGRGQIARR